MGGELEPTEGAGRGCQLPVIYYYSGEAEGVEPEGVRAVEMFPTPQDSEEASRQQNLRGTAA